MNIHIFFSFKKENALNKINHYINRDTRHSKYLPTIDLK